MKKALLVLALVSAAGVVVAQPFGGPGRGTGYPQITTENFATAKSAMQSRIAAQRETLEHAAGCIDAATTPAALQSCMQALRDERRQSAQNYGGMPGPGMGPGGGMGYGPRW
jgi:hypothetical protein